MKAPPFAYVRAASLADVFALWSEAGPDAKLLAGGQIAARHPRLPPVRALHADRHLARGRARRHLAPAGDGIRVGALTTHAELGCQRSGPPPRAAAGRGRTADRPSRHPQPRHHRRLAGLRRPRRRAAGLLRGARCRRSLRAAPTAERRIPAAQFFTGLYATALGDQRADRRRRVSRGASRASAPSSSSWRAAPATTPWPASWRRAQARRQARSPTRGSSSSASARRRSPPKARHGGARRQARDARDDRARRRPRSMPISTRPPICTAART